VQRAHLSNHLAGRFEAEITAEKIVRRTEFAGKRTPAAQLQRHALAGLNGLIQPFQQPERVLGFFNAYREGKRVTRRTLREIADPFQYWVKNRSAQWGAPILEPPKGDEDESRGSKLIEPYFRMPNPTKWWPS